MTKHITKILFAEDDANPPLIIGYNEYGNLIIGNYEFTPKQADEFINTIGETLSEAYARTP